MFTYSMSGRRFEQLLRCLCVYEGNAKGINKILDFANQMIAIFQDLYKPQQQLFHDESMLLFRGRLSFRQYIKTKKAKYGVKFYILTTSDGYILNFKINQGKNNDTYTDDTDTALKSKTEKLVMNLMQPYLYKGHEIYMDNYYNSVALSDKLLSCRTHTTGTLRKDRKDNPKEVVRKVLKKDEHVWMRKGKVYVSAWKDKRIVTMITTQHHPRLIITRNRFGKLLKKPKEVAEYNKYMSGIDISDQMLSYYSTPKKTIRWYKKVFFHIFDMAIWNAYYTFRKHCNDKETMLEFREKIVRYINM
nr:piggyBac transposable element-derived protein 4-like [Maniola hyperantus]